MFACFFNLAWRYSILRTPLGTARYASRSRKDRGGVHTGGLGVGTYFRSNTQATASESRESNYEMLHVASEGSGVSRLWSIRIFRSSHTLGDGLCTYSVAIK